MPAGVPPPLPGMPMPPGQPAGALQPLPGGLPLAPPTPFGKQVAQLVVIPALDLVYVIFMGNYAQPFPVQLQRVFAVQSLIHASLGA